MPFETSIKLKDSVLKAKSSVTIQMDANVPHALVIHEGRRPGARGPSGFHLKKWAREKLGDEGLAWPIARSIHKKGFPGVPYLTKTLKENRKQWEQSFGKVAMESSQKIAATRVGDAWQGEATFTLNTGTSRRFFKGSLVAAIQPTVTIK